MNTRLVNTAADVILRALTQNRTSAGIAMALESAQLLQSPETAAESAHYRSVFEAQQARAETLDRLLRTAQARVAELEAQLAEYERPADEVFVPRTELRRWQDIADALNAAHAAGMPVGIDLDGTLTDRTAWSVVWDRGAERWTVAGYDDEDEDSPGETSHGAPFTEARAAFMQMGTTPSLEGLRAELRIEGRPPLVGRYVGASMGRLHDVPGHEHLLAIDPRLIFEYADDEDPCHPCGCPKRFDRHAWGCPTLADEELRSCCAGPVCTCTPSSPQDEEYIPPRKDETHTGCGMPLTRRLKCGHCPHEVCEDCDRCPCSCECAQGGDAR